MTPETCTALKVIVERAVRPVQATLDRKKRMREELLTHVTEVFDEEVAASADEAAAIRATELRFGDPTTIAAELQRTVPAYDRPFFAIERITQERPGETVLRRAGRWAVFVSLVNAASTALIALPVAALSSMPPPQLSIAVQLLTVIAVASVALTFACVLLSNLLYRSLFRAEQRSIVLAGLSGLLSMIVPCVVAVVIYAFFSAELRTSLEMLSVSAAWLPVIPALLFVATWKFSQERAYRLEWASLQLDEH